MIKNITIGTDETEIYQTAVLKNFAVLTLLFCNTTDHQQTITVYAYPHGSDAGDATTFIKELAIDSYDTYRWTADEKFILGSLDKISAVVKTNILAAPNEIQVTVNGLEI